MEESNYNKARMYISAMEQAVKVEDKEQIILIYNECVMDKNFSFNGLDYLLQVWNHLIDKANGL